MTELGVPTERQAKFLMVFKQLTYRHERSPTIRELMNALHLKSPNGVVCYVTALVRKGYLKKRPGAYGISLTEQSWEARAVELLRALVNDMNLGADSTKNVTTFLEEYDRDTSEARKMDHRPDGRSNGHIKRSPGPAPQGATQDGPAPLQSQESRPD